MKAERVRVSDVQADVGGLSPFVVSVFSQDDYQSLVISYFGLWAGIIAVIVTSPYMVLGRCNTNIKLASR